MSLQSRFAVRFALVLPILAALLFLPAGTVHFWQGWVFLAIFAAFSIALLGYFSSRDPRLLERRLQRKESTPEQKLFQVMWMPLWICDLCLPCLDHRLHLLGGVPLWLTLFSQALLFCSWVLMFQVFKSNTFAAAVVQVETGQKVISTGPYRIVRHPMYSSIVVMILATPLALGSYISLPISLLLVLVLVFRLLNEEQFLSRELAGYTEYCLRTRFRLIPFLW